MKKFIKKLINTFEDVAIYIALTLIIFMSVLEYVFPNSSLLSSSNAYIALFSAALLLLYKKIDTIPVENKAIKTLDMFSEGVSEVLERQGKWKSLKIYAHTSYSYFNTIRQTNCVIEKVELILCNNFTSDVFLNRQDSDYNNRISKEYELSIIRWPALVQEGKIKNLEIRFIESIPSFHFAVFNEQVVIFGFLGTAHPSTKRYKYQDFIDNDNHSELIIDFVHYFDQMFSTAKSIYSSEAMNKNS